jgi:uncharacterized membrane protein YdfJ with MMPL/SSD domain
MTERLARAAALRPWRTVIVWAIAIVVALVAVGGLLPGHLTTEGNVTNNPESIQAKNVVDDHFPADNFATEIVVVRSEQLTVDQPAFKARLAQLIALGRATGSIAQLDTPRASQDDHAVMLPIRLVPDENDHVGKVIDVVKDQNGVDGFQVAMTGEFTTNHDFNEVSQHDLEAGELRFGLPAALIILLLVFGAVVAALMPLTLAIVSIVVALGLTALVAQAFGLSVFVVNMLTGMGLALGIDYALFVVSRFREERVAGREKIDAIATTGATASRAVLFSGSAFVLAMLGLLLVQSTIMRSLATGAILVGVTSVVAALTLLPAVLSILGDRVNRLRVPVVGRNVGRSDAAEGRFWGAIVRRVIRRPVISIVAVVAVLLVLASPVLGMHIGAAGIATLPDRLVSKQGYLALKRSFPTAGSEPANVVIQGRAGSPEIKQGIARLRAELRRDGHFGPVQESVSPDRTVTLLRVPVSADVLSDQAISDVKRLRSDYIPTAFSGVGAHVLVGGTTAENIDYFAVMRYWLPIVFAFVLGLSLVLLTIAFRSIVVAATAVVLNLLSVGAAYGLVVAVFQHGWGAGLLGFTQVDKIEAWVPLFLFAVLFGLSMDYQVFLLSRIRERFVTCKDATEAVTFGITSTARIITGAALIIVAVFLGFAMGDLVMFQQMGFGVAVALLIDATIVRSVLVPATMTLLGRWNWYLPSWLDWLPHVEVEAQHGAGEAAPAAR